MGSYCFSQRFLPAALVWSLLLGTAADLASGQRWMERLDRGVVAVQNPSGEVFVSWRLLGNDPEGVTFNVWRHVDGKPPEQINDQPLTGGTNAVDPAPAEGAQYSVQAIDGSVDLGASEPTPVWSEGYLEIPIVNTEGYRPGDASVGDLTGDGKPDIVIHQSSRGRDNSFAGITGTPVLEAYTLSGERLWRIDLGKNIREGEHYTQFLVYDLDGDGRAEVMCKTADGTVDGQGKTLGDADKDWRTDQPGSQKHGRILDGPEYLTVFDGRTGAELATTDYVPGRDPIDGWGGIGGNAGNDSYGNRCDRFLACVAYLDGQRPSAVMCRGVYGRIAIAAWDWRDGELTQRWVFDTGPSKPPYRDASPFAGMGGHSLSVADVDADGRDEIVYQAMVVDNDGQGLYSTGLRHGDVMYIADMDPKRPGLEVFSVQENEERAEQFATPGAAMRDARTGEILWSHSPAIDVPQGVAADIDPRHPGFEAWGGPGGLRSVQGEQIGDAPRSRGWTMWWDADPLREFLSVGRSFDGRGRRGRRRPPEATTANAAEQQTGFRGRPTEVQKWDWEAGQLKPVQTLPGVSFSREPCLVGDLLGDWREEVLAVSPDMKSLRLFTTSIPTDLRLRTLLHDPQYRLGLVWQNVAYNKPCYPSFYLADGMTEPSVAPIMVTPVSGEPSK
ncbi:Rhamnogalacturonan endolyase YesW precursor [Posidoniimonas corsicana]|uniref:Rhamnogalacturonan endolyase YesW n=1 Tax=Posidoniimonas corsicana TaxID=1938618 RepID=A0A5C5VIN8_9BACT|nr:rhamnogalacturonan lyase [Posidoniimonas corsicana]TWT37635.1 Rhamnogalacturonan endolyase YesW precursor [Posidoniimonas corsicana]